MSRPVFGLGIETSCDETSVAVVRDGESIISLNVYSQISEHAPFHGVVPEIASRSHLLRINDVYESAIRGIDPRSIDYLAVTSRPGLVGSLMIGGEFAKMFSLVYGIPIVCIDHLEAHLYTPALEQNLPPYPYIGLLLSGGNSSLYIVHAPGEMECIGDTVDDAIGEAFDKVASHLGLPYPGGPAVERLGSEWNGEGPPLFAKLLRDLPEDTIRFSYSGIKTAVIRAFAAREVSARICRDFQETVFELVERNLRKAVRLTGIRNIVAAGGVVANDTLRRRLRRFGSDMGVRISYPEKKILCTDNGAMVAALGYQFYKEKRFSGLNFSVSSQR